MKDYHGTPQHLEKLRMYTTRPARGRAGLTGSDKACYVPHGVKTGAPDRHCAHLPQYAAPHVRCTAFVRGRGGAGTSRAVHLTGDYLADGKAYQESTKMAAPD